MCELPQHFLLLLATTILELKLMAASKSFNACKTFVRIIWGGVRVDDCNHLEEVVHMIGLGFIWFEVRYRLGDCQNK
jgi:hypothetical protein